MKIIFFDYCFIALRFCFYVSKAFIILFFLILNDYLGQTYPFEYLT